MRILIVSQALNAAYGGSAVSEATLSSWLKKKHDVQILCRMGTVDVTFLGAHDAAPVREYRPTETVRALLDRQHPIRSLVARADVVHLNGHWRWENFFFALLCRRNHVPYVLHPRGMLWVGHRRVWLKRVFNWILGRWVVRWASQVIALSGFETRQFSPYRIDPTRIQVIPNGIFPETTASSPPVSRSKALPAAAFLYLGRLERRKNILFLLKAYALFRAEGGKNALHLIGPSERGYAKKIHSCIKRLRLEGVVLEPGVFQGDKNALYREALATIYPSYAEPFGRVPFEAIAAGGVAVVPRESGSAEYLERFLPDFVFRMGDAVSLLAVLKALSAGGHAFRSEERERARRWIQEELHWSVIADRTEAAYRDAIGATLSGGKPK